MVTDPDAELAGAAAGELGVQLTVRLAPAGDAGAGGGAVTLIE